MTPVLQRCSPLRRVWLWHRRALQCGGLLWLISCCRTLDRPSSLLGNALAYTAFMLTSRKNQYPRCGEHVLSSPPPPRLFHSALEVTEKLVRPKMRWSDVYTKLTQKVFFFFTGNSAVPLNRLFNSSKASSVSLCKPGDLFKPAELFNLIILLFSEILFDLLDYI